MFAIAAPKEDAAAAGCPFVASHAEFQNDTVEKKVNVFKGQDKMHFSDHLDEGDYLPIGTFKLSKLAQAFEQSDTSKSGSAVYDVITNNCSKFMMNLARQLGVEVDGKITSFVARRLIAESGQTLADQIRSSANFVSQFFGGRNLRAGADNDADLIKSLVESVAAKLE